MSSAAASSSAPPRYLVTFAYLPDEASWCVCRTFAAVAAKAKDLWDVADCALVYYITSHAGKATAVKITTEEDFNIWYRSGTPVTGKLIVHDRQRALKVTHSSGLCSVANKPIIDSLTLADLGATCYVRHSGVDEIFFIGEKELTVWGRAVQKAQRAWNVHRPLFRYVDDVHGERVVVSIVNAEDFGMWSTHRRPLLPELTVFEHAAPQLLDGPVSYAATMAAEVEAELAAVAAAENDAKSGAAADIARAPYRNPPALHNPESAYVLHNTATGRPHPDATAVRKTQQEEALEALQALLERRAQVAKLARAPAASSTSSAPNRSPETACTA